MAIQADKVNTGALVTLTLVGPAATLAIELAVTALVRHEVQSVEAKRSATADAEVRALKAEQRQKLEAAPAWADEKRTKVSLPIDRAMGLVLSDLRRNPQAATPAAPAGADAGAAPAPAEGAAAPQGSAPREPEAPKPEEQKKAEPSGTVGGDPAAPSPSPAAPKP